MIRLAVLCVLRAAIIRSMETSQRYTHIGYLISISLRHIEAEIEKHRAIDWPAWRGRRTHVDG